MTPKRAKSHLRKMLISFTGGSILHLLGEVFEELSEEAGRSNEAQQSEQLRQAATTLFVVGLGVDAICPR